MGRDRLIVELYLMTEEEKYRLLMEWNKTASDYPRDKGIDEIFEQIVEGNTKSCLLVASDQ